MEMGRINGYRASDLPAETAPSGGCAHLAKHHDVEMAQLAENNLLRSSEVDTQRGSQGLKLLQRQGHDPVLHPGAAAAGSGRSSLRKRWWKPGGSGCLCTTGPEHASEALAQLFDLEGLKAVEAIARFGWIQTLGGGSVAAGWE